MRLQLNNLSSVQNVAEKQVDEYFARKINDLIGPLAILHVMKYIDQTGELADNDKDKQSIATKYREQQREIAQIDRERRTVKTKIRRCKTTKSVRNCLDKCGIPRIARSE